MIYIRLFTNPLSQIAQAVTNLQTTAAASERVFEFLAEEEMSDESEKTKRLENARGDVEFKNVRFGYVKDKIIINNFSAHAKAGQKIAIVGPTGAGKTTMVNLLMRFYELNSGKILIDGIPTNELTRENVHDLFCMVLQDTWLFEGTIRENIVYSKEGVTDEEITRAVSYTHLILDAFDKAGVMSSAAESRVRLTKTDLFEDVYKRQYQHILCRHKSYLRGRGGDSALC